jgi:hypothetical protein
MEMEMGDESPLAATVQAVAEAVKGMSAAAKRRYRLDRGMCPSCGLEAAPYYLCIACRRLSSMTRTLNKMAQAGVLERGRKGRSSVWSVRDAERLSDMDIRGSLLFGIEGEDKRLRPRLGRRPVDLDDTLRSIFEQAGKPLSMEDIYFAWGRLRSQRKTGSLAGDMAAIIKAQQRRDERARKRTTGANHDQ